MISLTWSTALPTTYTHYLMATSPSNLPFAVSQSPLCGATLSYTFTPSLPWAAIAGSTIQISTSSFSLTATSYSFTLSATEQNSAIITTSPLSIILVASPCVTTTFSTPSIPLQTLYAWLSTTLKLAIPFKVEP